jgi:dihydrolipoamide dehydrogenase
MAYDVAVVGGGPGGYVAAIRAAQLGLNTVLIERARVGGVCLNWGCIPTKSLLRNADILNQFRNAREWGITVGEVHADYSKAYDRSRKIVDRLVKGVEFLLKSSKVDVKIGRAMMESPHSLRIHPGGEVVEATNIILATGAEARRIPSLPVDGERILTSYHTVQLQEQPKSILVAGAGAIGCEFAYLFKSYGAEVYLVEMLDHILPLEDAEIATVVDRAFTKQGIHVMAGSKVDKIDTSGEAISAVITTPKGQKEISVEKVLVAIGVKANTEDLGLDAIGVELERDWIKADGQMRTNVPGVYAIGDCAGPPFLAHVASAQGVIAAEAIAGRAQRTLRHADMPRATYCEPQVASLGLTEAQAREAGREIKIGKFPLRASGKALALGAHEGMIKVIGDAVTGELLGAHMVGPEVTEMLGEFAVAKTAELTTEDIARAVHPHPTISEGIMEAALATIGEALNIPNA